MTEQAVSRVQRGGLQVASELDALILDQAIPGTGVSIEDFGLDSNAV